jgi:plastocyanin
VGLAALLALSASGCGGDDDGDESAGSGETTEATDDAGAGTTVGGAGYGDEGDGATTTAADPGANGGDAVTVADFAFAPDSIEVPVGTEVTWSNEDDTTHTVTADDAAFDLSLDGSGTTASHTFDEAGEISYHCSIHESMVGTVVVVEG